MRTAILTLSLALLSLAAVPAAAMAGSYLWGPVGPIAPTQWALYRDGYHVGTYDAEDGVYRPKSQETGQWGDACDVPEDAGMPPGVARNFGVRRSKFSSKERYSINGRETSRSEVMDVLSGTAELAPLEEKKVPDDSKLPRITVAGSHKNTAAVLAAVEKWKGKYVVSHYRQDAWQLKRQGFVTPSDPTLYVQDADGAVLRRLDGYSGDQAALDQVLTECLELASRKKQPYDPSKDAGWKRVLPFFQSVKGEAVLFGVAALLIALPFILRKHK